MNEEWVTVPSGGRGRAQSMASFYRNGLARIPKIDGDCDRGDWQFRPSDPSQVRFLFHKGGTVKATHYPGVGSSWRLPSITMQRQIGRDLLGRFPCRVEGNAVLIDLGVKEAQS